MQQRLNHNYCVYIEVQEQQLLLQSQTAIGGSEDREIKYQDFYFIPLKNVGLSDNNPKSSHWLQDFFGQISYFQHFLYKKVLYLKLEINQG